MKIKYRPEVDGLRAIAMEKKIVCLIASIILLVPLLAEVVPVPEKIVPEKNQNQGPNKYYNI